MPLKICPSECAVTDCLPRGFVCIGIASISNRTNLRGKYVQAEIETRYNLHTYQVSSIKFVLKNNNGKRINLNAYGGIARDLDICGVGDSLVLTNFDVDVCPKNKTANGLYQIILDDQKPVKPVVWVIKSNQNDNINSSPTPVMKASSSRNPVVSSPNLMPVADSIDTNQNQGRMSSYTYTPLNDIQIRTMSHVYGVVSYTKYTVKSSGSDYFMMLNIVDPSLPNLEEKLPCLLFHAQRDKLPTQAVVGDIIRFHRLKIQSYQGKKQGRGGPGFHWVLFQGCYETRVSSSQNYTLEAVDKKKVRELLKWWEDVTPLFSQDTNLATASDDSEPSTVCSASPIPSTSGLSSRLSSASKSVRLNEPSTVGSASPIPSTSGLSSQSSSASKSVWLNKLTPLKAQPIIYKSLKDVQGDTIVSLYGVVVYARPLVFTSRSEHHLMMNISDPSLENKDAKLTCNLFHADKNKLPHQAMRGDVIRFHCLKIQFFRGKKQAVKENNLEWILFQQSFDQRVTSSPNCVVKDDEESKVQSLLDWWLEGPDTTPFSKVDIKQYFCLVCQIIAVCLVEEKHYRLLRVWDGTKFNGPISNMNIAGIEENTTLATAAGDLAHDVFVFDNHISSTDNVKPGDYIKVTNLHAPVVNGKVEMTLHGGTAYQRGVKILSANDRAVVKLKSVLEPLISQSRRGQDNKNKGDSTSPSPRRGGNKNDGASTSRKRLFDEPSEFESKSKRRSFTKDPEVDNVNGSKHLHGSGNNSNNNSNDDNVIVISDSSNATFTQESSGNNYAYCTDSLNLSSLPSPPDSLNLSERDRFMIKAYFEREKRKEVEGAPSTATRKDGEEDKKNTEETDSSCISSSCSQGVWLSIYDSASSTGKGKNAYRSRYLTGQEIRKVEEIQRLQRLRDSSETDSEERQGLNSRNGKGTNSVSKQRKDTKQSSNKNKRNTENISHMKEYVAVTSQPSLDSPSTSHRNEGEITSSPHIRQHLTDYLNPVRKTNNIESNSAVMDELVSSQDSFHTAVTNPSSPVSRSVPDCTSQAFSSFHTAVTNHSSPVSRSVPDCTSQAFSVDSPRKCLSLRSPTDISKIGPSTSSSISSRNSVNKVSGVTSKDSVMIIESEDVVSSSVESQYSLPMDRQPTEQNEEEISSSTDSKDSKRDGESIATAVSLQNQSKKCFELESLMTCRENTKCKVRVRLRDYFPRTGNVADLVKFCCFTCKCIVPSSDIRYKRVVKCPNGCGTLQPHIIIKMLLSDGEYDILTVLWRHNAVEFFQGVAAEDLLHNASARDKVKSCLDKLCLSGTELEDRPLMECCLFCYFVKNKIHFQIFDTTMVL